MRVRWLGLGERVVRAVCACVLGSRHVASECGTRLRFVILGIWPASTRFGFVKGGLWIMFGKVWLCVFGDGSRVRVARD